MKPRHDHMLATPNGSSVPNPPRNHHYFSVENEKVQVDRRFLQHVCTQHLPYGFPTRQFLPQASEILPNLYIADMYTATSLNVLTRLRITHVLSVVRSPRYQYPPEIRHLCIPIEDTHTTNIAEYFDHAARWIHHALTKNSQPYAPSRAESSRTPRTPKARVLVHCMWGMSRSASIVIAYLMMAKRMSLRSALAFVKERRSIIRPNRGFIEQLIALEQRLEFHPRGRRKGSSLDARSAR